ncbi:MAG TPA: hypothetical protein VGO58_00805 [Chitinophagaceae bacterium]|jgi:hypothetical protein|nr:hypothetical protein [Chitinophagaceae bacterium]
MKTSLLQETHELVASLTRTEKRYFKLYTGFQQGDKSYLGLFDIIDKHSDFDEKKISQKFSAKNKVTNFPAVIKYLFDQLVASLRSYGSYKDLDSDHNDLIETYKVLQYKGLHGQSGRLLKKIKSITLQDDAFIRHFYVLLLEYVREMFNAGDSGVSKVQQILEEKKHVFNIIQNYTEIGDLFSYQRLYLRKKLYCRTREEKEELTRLMAPVLKTSESDMLSRTAMGLRSLGLCDYYMAIGKPMEAFRISKTYLETRKNAGGAEKIDTGILTEHLQHLWLSVRSGIYEDFEENINKFKTLIDPIRNRQKFIMGYERWYNYSFIYYNRTGQFSKAIEFLAGEKTTMAAAGNDFSMKAKIMLWYFTAYNNYVMKDYRSALKMIQRIMSNTNDEMEEFSFAKLLLMFIHYDLKNHELLEYQVRSYHRLMHKTERVYKCEKIMLEFFKTIAGIKTRKLRREQLEELQKRITAIFRTPYERGFSFYFDIRSWIESELTGKDFSQVVRKKYA